MALTVAELRAVFTADLGDLKRGEAEAIASTRRVGQQMQSTGRMSDEAWGKVSRGSRNAFIAGAAGLAIMTKANMDFDKSMSAVSAATMASEADLGRLRTAAIKAGADTQFSATEAAQGVTELAKAGVATGDVLGGGLAGALDLAAAGQIGVAEAAETAASAMVQFNLQGKEVPRIADLLAAGAGKAQGGVSQLGQALAQGGLIAAQTGLSLEDTVGALSAFASNGLIGSDAGTAFKTMLMSLNPRSAEAAKLMDDLGIGAFDAKGEFIGLAEYSEKLKTGLSGMSSEQRNATLQTIFGTDAIRAANILYKEGERGIEGWIRKVDDQGYAAETAARQTDNLAGDLERLTGSLESAFINGGSGFTTGLRDIVQGAERAVDWFNELPSSVQAGTVKVLAMGTAASGILYSVTKIRDAWNGLKSFVPKGIAGKAAGSALGGAVAGKSPVPVMVMNPGFDAPGGAAGGAAGGGKRGGTPVVAGAPAGGRPAAAAGSGRRVPRPPPGAGSAAAVGALAALGLGAVESALDGVGRKGQETGGKLYASFEKPKGGVAEFLFGPGNTMQADFSRALGALDAGEVGKIGEDLDRALGGSMSKGIDNVRALDRELSKVSRQDPSAGVSQWKRLLDDSGLSAEELTRVLPRTAVQLGKVKEQLGSRVGGSMFESGLNLAEAAIPKLERYRKVLQGVPKSIRSYVSTPGSIKSLGEMQRVAKQYNLTPKQIRTIMRLQGFPETQGRIAAAGKSYRGLPKEVKTALKAETVKTMADVKRLQAQYKLTPAQKRTVMQVSGVAQSLSELARLRASIDAVRSKSVTVETIIKRRVSGNANIAVPMATGGPIVGPGGPRDDQVPVMASNGEFMVNAAAYARNRRAVEFINAGGRVDLRAARFLAAGGPVSGPSGTRLEILEAERQLRDLDRELAARRKRTVKVGKKIKGKPQKTRQVDAGPAIVGLDRDILLEQRKQAGADLRRLRAPEPAEIPKDRKQLADGVRSALSFDLFATGATSVSQLIRNGGMQAQTNAQWATLIAGLTKAKLDKGLIDQFVAQGPTAQALALGKSILGTAGAAGSLNNLGTGLGQQAAAGAAYATGGAATPVVNIDKWYAAPGQSETELAERLYFISRIRK